MAKTTPSSQKSDAPGKTGSAKTRAKTSAKKPAAKRDTMASLREDINKINTRIKRANTLTRKSIESLEISFEILEKRASQQQTVNQEQLNEKITLLAEHLNGAVERVHKEISEDVRQAVSSRDMDEIYRAVTRAGARLDETELNQAEALSRVNKHIADLAKAIDERLTQEQASNQQNFRALADKFDTQNAKVNLRLNKIEDASAAAIRQLGDKIVALSDELTTRADKNTSNIQSKLGTIGQNTQHSIEQLRKKLERRLESVEEAQKNLDSYADRTLTAVNTRLDSLEYGLIAAAPSEKPAADPAPTSEAEKPKPVIVEVDDPFAPTEPPIAAPPENVSTHSHLAAVPAAPSAVSPEYQAFGPVEYTPEPYAAAAQYPQQAYPQPAQPQPQTAYPAADPYAQPAMAQAYPQPAQTPVMPELTETDLPYENPAYAESDTTHRPGDVDGKKKRKKKVKAKRSSSSGGDNQKYLKVAGLGIAVLGAGYFAMNMMGSKGTQPAPQNTNYQQTAATTTQPPVTVPVSTPDPIVETLPPVDTSIPPIGQYEEVSGAAAEPIVEPTQSLETAAASGNAVAEFQLGLSYLESGRVEDGIAFIRAAANKDQPAAQYRLAKLYESGTGVTADPEMARQLTERAARNGNRIAMHDLALYYAEGRGGVSTDIGTAANWFEKAAERGVVDSQFNLGVLFESGQGIPRNVADAYVWYSIAAKQGDQFAQERRDILRDQLAAEDLSRADARISQFAPTKIDEAANGIFRDVPWIVSDNPALSPTATLVKEAQSLLGELGYDAGVADGQMGPKTKAAIISFQRSVGLTETGEVTTALIDRMEIAAGT